MTANSPRLTDDLLRRALSELAAGPDADVLMADVLRSVDAQAQANRRPWDSRGWRRAALLMAAAALLATAAVGATVTLSRPEPTPMPSATPSPLSRPIPSALPLSERNVSVADFAVPFTYRLPLGEDGKLAGYGNQERVYFVDAPGKMGRLELFPVNGTVHGCGTSEGNGLPTSGISTDPAEFLQALRDEKGAGMGPITTTRLGTLPAFTADIYPTRATCDHVAIHENGLGLSYAQYEPALNSPGQLIVTRLNGQTIGLLISAPSEEALRDWMPVAQAYVNGLVFETDR